MNPTTLDSPWAGEAVEAARRWVREQLAGRAVDGDGALDETWAVLRQKRGCRR